MNYILNDGTHELTTDADREDKLRRMIDEKLGRDAETWFNDVLEAAKETAVDEALGETDKGLTLLSSQIDSILYHLDDYVKNQASLRTQLKNLKSRIEEYMPAG